jgi:hypothetical protein
MKRLFILILMIGVLGQTQSQFIHKIKADSVLITNDSCTAELNLENSTKHIKGFLYNKGNGRTEFRKAVKLNDSVFVFGDDTLINQGRNFANADLILTGNRTHNINNKTLLIRAVNGTDSANLQQTSTGFSITGKTQINAAVLDVVATGVFGYGIKSFVQGNLIGIVGTSSGGTGISGGGPTGVEGSSNGNSGYGSASGFGLRALYYGNSPHGASIMAQRSSTEGANAVRPAIRILNNPQVVSGNGIGTSIRWEFVSYNTSGNPTGFDGPAELSARMTNLRGINRTSEFNFSAMGDSVMRTILTLNGKGNIVLPNYGDNTWQVNDTTNYKPLVVDVSGNVSKGFWPNSVPGVSSITSSSTITPNALTDDVYAVTALAENTTIAAPSGTFNDGKIIVLRLKDNGTSRTISWNTIYRGGTDFSLPTSTSAGKTMYITFIWNAVDSKLDGVGLSKGY